jgi:PAS domain S-box-containing protein
MSGWPEGTLEYLLLCAGCAAVLASLERWLRGRPVRGTLPRWAWIGAGVLLVAGWLYVSRMDIGDPAVAALTRQWAEGMLVVPIAVIVAGAAIAAVSRAERGARVAMETRLRETEARLRTAIDSIPCDLWMMDERGRYTLFNAAARGNWGDLMGRTLDDLPLSPATREQCGAANRRAFSGELVRQEIEFERRGRKLRVLSIVAPVRVDGVVAGILGVHFDLTERLDAEEALRRSQEKLALHVRQTPLAVIEWNLAFRVTAWNPSAERIFGFTAAEAIGRHAVGLIVTEDARPQVERMWAALLTHKGGTRTTINNVTRDGRSIRCEWYNTPLVDSSGAVIGVASSVHDITDRDALEKQLRQAQKMESIGQLAGGVAHEFNNLLTPMLVQTEIISQTHAHDAKLLALLRPIRDAAQQAAQLNQRILTLGRRAAEQREMQLLNPLVENAVALLRPTLDRRIELDLALAPRLAPILIDRGNIAQIVMNLVLNARDTVLEKLEAGAPAGWTPRITISTTLTTSAGRREGASASPFTVPCQRLTVTDNGLGIPVEKRAQVFEPFFTTKAPGRGTGLGLAVVWSVVRGLRGWIEFEPGPGGEGTSFHVFFPLVQATPGAGPAVAAPAAEPGGGSTRRALRVLLVDDNALVSETFAALLGAAGHSVVAATDGGEGWEIFSRRNGEFDLVLADCNMPGLNGADLLRRIKATEFRGRVVLVSGYLTPEMSEQLTKLGADAVLRKPFTPSKLMAAIAG